MSELRTFAPRRFRGAVTRNYREGVPDARAGTQSLGSRNATYHNEGTFPALTFPSAGPVTFSSHSGREGCIVRKASVALPFSKYGPQDARKAYRYDDQRLRTGHVPRGPRARLSEPATYDSHWRRRSLELHSIQVIPLQSSVGAIKDLPRARQAQPTGYAVGSAAPQRQDEKSLATSDIYG
jgi:hypothetical protein